MLASAAVDLDGREIAVVANASVDARLRERRAWARSVGCRCNVCPLAKDGEPVRSELRPDARFLVVGEAPGGEEVDRNVPFIGKSGRELMKALQAAGLTRADVSLTNAMACKPPGEWQRYQRKLGRENAKRRKAGQPIRLSPLDCCLPRLRAEIAAASAVLLVGGTALASASKIGLQVVRPFESGTSLKVAQDGGDGEAGDDTERAQGEAGVTRLRGFPLRVMGKPALAAYHPAFVLRSRRFTEVFRSDVAKASRHAIGRLAWREPAVVFDPSIGELDAALSRLANAPYAVIDTETDGLDPEGVDLRCVGLGAVDFGVAAGFRSVERPARAGRCDPSRARERIANFINDASRRAKLALHNQAYDRRVLERHGMPLPVSYAAVAESLAAHHVVDSELPHSLAFLSSVFTDAPMHKAVDHSAWDSDRELHVYCVMDTCVSASLVSGFLNGVVESRQIAVYKSDLELQRLAVGMHRAGLMIDEGERRRHAARLELDCARAQARADAAVGGKAPSLSNNDAVRDFLYRTWSSRVSPPIVETAAGDPSVDKDAMYEILERRSLRLAEREFVEACLDYRRAYKKLTAYTGRVVDGAWRKGPRVDADGRVRPTYNATSTVVGRLSCSDPNAQTIPSVRDDPDSLRSMFVAAPGNVLVACDMDQLHLRLIAARAGDRPWIDAFNEGLDVHAVNAALFFGKPREAVEKFERTHMKTAAYLYVYGGGAQKSRKLMLRMRDPKTGARPYADMTIQQANVERARFLHTHPALEKWWDREIAQFRARREVRSMILGRRKRFLDLRADHGDDAKDEEARSEIVNFGILSSEGDIMGGAGASGRAMELIGWPWEVASAGRGMGGPGIVLQNHDSLMVEVSEYRAYEAAAALEKAMRGEIVWEGRRVPLTATAKIGRRWSELG